MISRTLLSASAAIMLFLGGVHLLYTAFTPKLNPSEGQVETAMRRSPIRIFAKTPVWDAWIGFNFSHRLGLILLALCSGTSSHADGKCCTVRIFWLFSDCWCSWHMSFWPECFGVCCRAWAISPLSGPLLIGSVV
jgi:hypothetical protein